MPRTPAAETSVDASQLFHLAVALKSVDDKATLRSLRAGLRAAAKPIADRARQNAAEVSSKVAATITVETAFTASRTGVFITAKRNKMPAGHAPLPGLLERGSQRNGGASGTFRHPVFGDDTNWVSQPMHPFLAPAVAGQQEKVAETVRAAVDVELHRHGLGG